MTVAGRKPRLFIGSSVERLEIAYCLQELLEYDSEPTVWTQGIFEPSSSALSDLVKATETQDFAAFVLAADDLLVIRRQEVRTPRDNVIFELGLFIGAVGVTNCFLITPRGQDPLHLPSDLIGLAPITYADDRSDGNFLAALGPASNQVRRAMAKHTAAAHDGGQGIEQADHIRDWSSPDLLTVRDRLRRGIVMDPYDPDFEVARPDLVRLFAFLDSMSDAVLTGRLDESKARVVFEDAVLSSWPRLATLLAPPNHADDFWNPVPGLGLLYARWK